MSPRATKADPNKPRVAGSGVPVSGAGGSLKVAESEMAPVPAGVWVKPRVNDEESAVAPGEGYPA